MRPAVGHSADIVSFYSGVTPDNRGRYLSEILSWSDQRLEDVHDYIQWLFPLPEPSGANPEAPVLDDSAIAYFKHHSELRDNVRRALNRMLQFYGLSLRTDVDIQITRNPDFEARTQVWLTRGNHNHLRLTRILRSLCVLGLPAEAQAVFNLLVDLYENEVKSAKPRISSVTFDYWARAVRC